MFELSETSIKVTEVAEESKSEDMWRVLEQNYDRSLPFIE
jgi:hypothetical protein